MPGPGPDERVAPRVLHHALVAGADRVHRALPEGRRLAFRHTRPEALGDVLHGERGDLVRQAHALDLLCRLQRTGLGQERGGIDSLRKRLEEPAGRNGGLADHQVGRLRALGELEPDAVEPELVLHRERRLERARSRGPRIVPVVAAKEPDVARPGRFRRYLRLRLEHDQHRLALAREDEQVVALHREVVREVEDVVRGAHDERVQLLVGHQGAYARELLVVARPGHPVIPPGAAVARRGPPARRRPGFAARRSARSRTP